MKKNVPFLAVVVLLSIFTHQSQAQTQYYTDTVVAPSGQTLYYYFDSVNLSIVITFPGTNADHWSTSFTKPTGDLVLPDSVNHYGTTYPVKKINYSAFKGCSDLTSLTISPTITYIGQNAFLNCNGLTGDLVIPDSVNYISHDAFKNCRGITSVTIGSGLKTIYSFAFSYCSGLTSVVFNADSCTFGGESVTSTPFFDCPNITSFTFGENVKHIPDYLCCRLNGLTKVTIPASVRFIGSSFISCHNLDTVYMMPLTKPYIPYSLEDHCSFYDNAPGRVIILSDCSAYDNYYTNESNSAWYFYRDDLRDPVIDILVSVSSSDETHGSAAVIQHHHSDVRCDSTTVVEATANTGYRFSHWSNGSTANPYTLQLTGDTVLTAYFEADSTLGISDIATDIIIYSGNGCIVVEGTTDEVYVYDIMGRRMRNEALPMGVYMVRIGERPTRKVVVTQ